MKEIAKILDFDIPIDLTFKELEEYIKIQFEKFKDELEARYKIKLDSKTIGQLHVIYEGQLLEIGETIILPDKTSHTIEKTDTLADILKKFGYDFKLHVSPINLICDSDLSSFKRQPQVLKDYKKVLQQEFPGFKRMLEIGRVFEGRLNLWRTFGTFEGAQLLNNVYNDIVQKSAQNIKITVNDLIDNGDPKKNELRKWFISKIESERISQDVFGGDDKILEDFKNLLLNDQPGERKAYYNERFGSVIQEMIDNNKADFKNIFEKIKEEFVVLNILEQIGAEHRSMDQMYKELEDYYKAYVIDNNKWEVSKMKPAMRDFYNEFYKDSSTKPSKISYKVLNAKFFENEKTKKLFLERFANSLFESSGSFVSSYSSQAGTFISGISERISLTDIMLVALAKKYQEAIDAGGDVNFEFFHAAETILGCTSVNKIEDFIKHIIGSKDQLKDIKIHDNGGIEIYSSDLSNMDFFDVLVGILVNTKPGNVIEIKIVSSENKNSRTTSDVESKSGTLWDIVVDHYRKIHMNKYIKIKYETQGYKVSTFTSEEHYVLPFEDPLLNKKDMDDYEAAIMYLLRAIFIINNPSQFKDSHGNIKGDSENMMYLELAKMFNEKLQDSGLNNKADIKLFFNDLKKQLKKELNNIKDEDKIHETDNGIVGSMVKAIKVPYSNDLGKLKALTKKSELIKVFDKFNSELDKLLILNNYDGKYELRWYETLRCHLESSIPLTKNYLADLVDDNEIQFIIDTNGKKISTSDEIRKMSDITFNALLDTPMLYVHDDSGHLGIMPNNIKTLPSGISEGFLVNTGTEIYNIKGVYFSNEMGNLLESQVYDPIGNVFEDRGEKWYEAENVFDIQYSKEFIDGKERLVGRITYWRASTKVTGDKLSSFIEKVEAVIDPLDPYKKPVKAPVLGKGAEKDIDRLIENEFITTNSRYKLELLSFVLMQLTDGKYSLRNKDDKAIFIPKEILNLHYKEGKYSKEAYDKIFEALLPNNGDGTDFSELINLYKYLTSYSVKGDDSKPNFKFQKQFYMAWLKLMQNDLNRESERSGLFDKYEDKLYEIDKEKKTKEERDFSSELEKFDTDDLNLVESIDNILKELFGTIGLSLLFMGVIQTKMSETSGKYEGEIDFILPKTKELHESIKTFRIKAYYNKLKEGEAYKYDRIQTKGTEILSSMFLSGFSHELEGLNGEFRAHSIDSPTDEFIDDLYILYEPKYGVDYSKVKNSYMQKYYNVYTSEMSIAEMNTNGRALIIDLVCEKAYQIIDKMFDDNNIPLKYKTTPEMKENMRIRTKNAVSDLIMRYIDRPSTIDYVSIIQEIISKGSGQLTIKGGFTYGSNEILEDGITLDLKREDFGHFTGEIYLACVFSAVSATDDTEQFKEQGKIRPQGFYLDAKTHFTPELIKKLQREYNLYRNMFEKARSEGIEETTIKFYYEKGEGFHPKYLLDSYQILEFKKGSKALEIPVKLSDEHSMNKAIQSIIFYTHCLPNLHALIYKGKRSGLLFGTDGMRLYDGNYYKSKAFYSDGLDPGAVWSLKSELAPYAYQMMLIGKTSGERRYLQMFSNVGVIWGFEDAKQKDMLRYLWKDIFVDIIRDEWNIEPEIEDLTEGEYLTS